MNASLIKKTGRYSALVAAVAAAGYTVAQILQLLGYLVYPYDEILIYGFSLCIAPPFMLAVLSLHYTVTEEKKFLTHAAVLFSVMYVVFVAIMYVVQLAAVLPYNMTDPVLLVTPHSFFWTLDALGYISMGVAALFIVPVFTNQGPQKWVKWFFAAHALLTPVIAFVYFYPKFSTTLLVFGAPWSITATGSMLLLSVYFKKN